MCMFIKQCMTFALTFLNSLSTSVASSIFLSRRSFWISRIQATRLTYGLWLALLSTPGSLSDLSIRDVNKKSPLRSLSPVLSRCFRRLLEKFSLSRLFCRLSLEPMIAVTLKTQCYTKYDPFTFYSVTMAARTITPSGLHIGPNLGSTYSFCLQSVSFVQFVLRHK